MQQVHKLAVADFLIKSGARGDQLRKVLTALLTRAKNGVPESAAGAINRLDQYGSSFPFQRMMDTTQPAVNNAEKIKNNLLKTFSRTIEKPRKSSSPLTEVVFGRGGPKSTTGKSMGNLAASRAEDPRGHAPEFTKEVQKVLQHVPSSLFGK